MCKISFFLGTFIVATATLNEIKGLSIEDRIMLVQEIWDSIAAEQVAPKLTEAQKHRTR